MGNDKQVSGLRALVVGASSGIGRELAVQLAAGGADVVAAARRLDRLREVPGVTPVACDVRDPKQCDRAVAAAREHLGGIDALIYASGVTRITPLDRSGIDAWTEIFETNLFGAALIARAAIPHLSAPGSQGRALFLSSDSADLALPGLGAYSASKAALGRFCQALADELPELRVSEVVVGPTAGTEVGTAFDPSDFARWAVRWFEEGFVRHGMQQPHEVVAVILDALTAASPARRVVAAGPVQAAARTVEEGRRQAGGEE